ncbi:MAG TPA: DMT family transporter [Polyangiales bacterium]|jgi:drug/metabolite transporter (DMT)-like permease|nr:DMT family transporter [Polyangiales bacterium]
MADASSETRGVWFAVASAVFFSAKAILVKLAYPYGVSATTLLTLRMIVALPAFLVVAIRLRGPLRRRDAFGLIILGVVGYYGASLFDFIGLQYISAGLERLIVFTYPTLTLLLALFAFGRRFDSKDIVALCVTWAGIALAFAHDLAIATDAPSVWIGAGWVFASSICYAIYLAGAGELVERLGSLRVSGIALCVSSAAVFVHFLCTRPLGDLVQPAPVLWLALAMGIGSTVLPVFMQMAAIERLGASRAAMISTLGPVSTIALSAIVLHEPVSARQMAGTLLVLVGVRLAGSPRAPRAARSA